LFRSAVLYGCGWLTLPLVPAVPWEWSEFPGAGDGVVPAVVLVRDEFPGPDDGLAAGAFAFGWAVWLDLSLPGALPLLPWLLSAKTAGLPGTDSASRNARLARTPVSRGLMRLIIYLLKVAASRHHYSIAPAGAITVNV
jgi:hypothetical protein